MRRYISQRKRAVKDLKFVIDASRKIARQVNRKLAQLEQLNKLKQNLKDKLKKLCEKNQLAK